jgi:enoyl-CoA hydratase/carnithine racemase
MYSEIIYEVEDPVATITLNRPDAMNAWTPTMESEIRDAVARASADRSVVGIVVTGAGRSFCAGADMKGLSALSQSKPSDAAARSGGVEQPPAGAGDGNFAGRFPFLMQVDKPIIAAINGAVAGMAYPFTLCCDIRVVTPDSLFVTAFAQRGLIAEWGLSWLLPRLIGAGNALDLLFTSRRVKGEEAYRLGLASYLMDSDQLLPFCRDYVKRLAETCSPSSLAVMKKQVYEDLHTGLGAADAASVRLMGESFGRPDFAEGVSSFVEKRPPQFNRLPL